MAVWSTLLAITLWSSAISLPKLYSLSLAPISPSASLGFQLTPDGSAIGRIVEPYGSRAGLKHGDLLIAVDGKPANVNRQLLFKQLAGPDGAHVTVTTRSPAGSTSDHLLTHDPHRYARALAAVGLNPLMARLAPYTIDLVLDAVVVLACAVVLMVRRARDPLAPWASLMMLWMVIGDSPAGAALHSLFPDPTLSYNVSNDIAFALLVVVLAVFPQGRFDPPWSLAVAVFGVVTAFLTSGVTGAEANLVLLVEQLAAVAAIAAIAARYRAMPPGTGRQQIRWAMLGFAASTLALIPLSLIQYAMVHVSDVGVGAWLAIAQSIFVAALTILLIVGITVSLLRYRLYDADATISRSIVYGTLTVTLLAIFAGSEKVIELVGERYLGDRLGALAGGIGAAIAAATIVPLHHRVTRWAEHRFRSGLVRLRDGLPLLVGDMRETATPGALADAILLRVEKGVRARHGVVVVAGAILDVRDVDEAAVSEWLACGAASIDGPHRLHTDRADPLFPMRVPLHADGVGLVGWLLLGPRPDGSFYGREERQALQEIAEPVARALAIAIERERREADRHEREAALHREVSALRGAFGALRRFVSERFGVDLSDAVVAGTSVSQTVPQ